MFLGLSSVKLNRNYNTDKNVLKRSKTIKRAARIGLMESPSK